MEIKHYVITAVITYAFFLIITLPASLVVGLFNETAPQLTIQGVNGTLWDGFAQRITYSSKHMIDDASWSLCSWCLLTGSASVDLDATYRGNPIHGQLAINVTGTVTASDLNAEIDALQAGLLAGLPIAELGGLVSIQLESATWAHQQVPHATGTVRWKNASVTVAETASLGDITITLSEPDDFPLAASISNQGGHIALNGEAQINDDGNYNSKIKLVPNSTASKNIRSSLGMFAKQQNDGSFVLKNTGNLKQFGIM